MWNRSMLTYLKLKPYLYIHYCETWMQPFSLRAGLFYSYGINIFFPCVSWKIQLSTLHFKQDNIIMLLPLLSGMTGRSEEVAPENIH